MTRDEMLNIIADTPCGGPRGTIGHDLAEQILLRIESATPEHAPEVPVEPELT